MLAVLAASLLFPQTPSAPRFADMTTALGITAADGKACWVDIDRDGWTDLVAGGFVWRNEHGNKFIRMDHVGDVVAADFDNDGYPDLFDYSEMKLYRNIGGKRFEEIALPKLPATVSRGACWVDLDGDGFVNLYVGGYEDWDKDITYPSFILRNEGGKSFKLVWSENKYRTRGVTACDFNRSGFASVYASNYRLMPNNLWLSDGKGSFRDIAPEYNAVATSPGFDGGHSIGACWGDFDNDGEFDLFAGNFAHRDSRGDQPKSRFLRNSGAKGSYKFEDMGTCGVFYQESYASPAAADYDNSGSLSLYFTTVYGVASFKVPNYPVLYKNQGGFKFVDSTAGSGLEKLTPTYQAAWADYDNSGKLSLMTAGKLFKNQATAGHWLEVSLEGDGVKVNRSAIGAQVRIKIGKETLTRQVEAGTGEGNQNDLRLHFGLGAFRGRVSVEIRWPNGEKQTVRHVPVDKNLSVKYR